MAIVMVMLNNREAKFAIIHPAVDSSKIMSMHTYNTKNKMSENRKYHQKPEREVLPLGEKNLLSPSETAFVKVIRIFLRFNFIIGNLNFSQTPLILFLTHLSNIRNPYNDSAY